MSPLNITFGIELEFLCVYPPGCFSDYILNDDEDGATAAAQAIYMALHEDGIPVTGFEATAGHIPVAAEPYSRWRVHFDETVELTAEEKERKPDGWLTESIELTSRKFSLSNDDWQAEIQAVLDMLTDVEALGCRMLTNKTTGFHVHIGNDAQLIPVRTAKKVFQLITAFEKCIDRLHTVRRIQIPASEDVESHCYLPPCWFHTHNNRTPEGANVFEWLASIENAQTYEDLGALFAAHIDDRRGPVNHTDGHNSAYNFDNLFADSDGVRELEGLTGTIEFRQHEGTLQPGSIVAWIVLASEMVRYSHEASDSDMLGLLAKSVDHLTNLQSLLDVVCRYPDVTRYYVSGEHLMNRDMLPDGDVLDILTIQNTRDRTERSKISAVQAVISSKLSHGDYGIDPQAETLSIPAQAIEQYLHEAWMAVQAAHPAMADVQRLSLAKSQVLIRLSSIYGKQPLPKI